MHRLVLTLLLFSMLLTPLAVASKPTLTIATDVESIHLTNVTELPERNEVEPNNRIVPPNPNAQWIAEGRNDSWRQPIVGTLSSASDIDYFRFIVDAPGSLVTIDLTNLVVDYDIVFGGGVDPVTGVGGATETFEFDNGEAGLEGVTHIGGQIASIGGQIASIGGQIASIGGQIASIGGQIASIGGQIASIGGQIASISVNPGTRDERIETIVWQPGLYFVAVAPSNAGQTSAQPYRLTITMQRSTLQPIGPAPHVQFFTDVPDPDVTTLYIINTARMAEVYPDDPAIETIAQTLNSAWYSEQKILVWGQTETGLVKEKGAVIDLANLQVIPESGAPSFSQLLTNWSQPANQRNPLYANYIASIVDHVIEAATSPDNTGHSRDVRLGYRITADNDSTPNNENNSITPYPNVRHIVLIGSDEIIPFFRLPDLTTIANEAEYLNYLKTVDSRSNNASIIIPDSPLGAALRNRMLLSDNPYGTVRPYRFYGFPLFIPDLAVGRIVEQPAEIADFLRRNNPMEEVNISLRNDAWSNTSYSITGYDFLMDGASFISSTLQQATQVTSTLLPSRIIINNNWNRTSFEQQWLEQPLNATNFFTSPLSVFSTTQTLLSSLNAHFDHWQLIPAVAQGSTPNFPADRLLTVTYDDESSCDLYPMFCPGFFYNTIYYSVGCHSGYNVPFSAILQPPANSAMLTDPRLSQSLPNEFPSAFYAADFAQAFNRHGGNWVGNTGYGYGTLDGIDYSERLAGLYTQELTRREVRPDREGFTYVGRSIGEALVSAKQRYLRTVIGLNAYDYKVLSIMTLYGLPWKRVFVDNPLNASVEDLNAELPVSDRTAPVPIAGSQLTRTITFTINYAPNYLQTTRTGQRVQLQAEQFTITDTFLLEHTFNVTPTVTVIDNNLIGMPGLPAFTYDITALSGSDDDSDEVPLVVRDVIFLGGTYNTVENFNPTVTQIVTETFTPLITSTIEPDFSAGIGFWVPDRFFGHSRVGYGADQRDTLISTAAQFRASNGVTGTLRTYTQLVYQVIYTDPEASGAEQALADNTPPVIEQVRIEGQPAGLQTVSTLIEVIVSDPDNPSFPDVTVSAVYLDSDNVTWLPLDFNRDQQNPLRWTASVPRPWMEVRLIITAIDGAGNAVMYTAKGNFAPPSYLTYMPIISRNSAH
ncbi:MAG: peptidase [Chloroflexus sp.]